MTNLMTRVLTGVILVLIIISSLLLGQYVFFSLMIIINILTLREFYNLYSMYTGLGRNVWGVFLSVAALLSLILLLTENAPVTILMLDLAISFTIIIRELFLRSPKPTENLALLFFGIMYITVPVGFFIALSRIPGISETFPDLIMGYFILLWAGDSGAYFSGKKFGRHPLFYRLSPGKTWEGSFGGMIISLLTAFILSKILPVIATIDWFMLSIIIIITGTLGDLSKSMMKRSLGVKDSGKILPGHGGMLDRFDSLLGSAPFAFCYFMLRYGA